MFGAHCAMELMWSAESTDSPVNRAMDPLDAIRRRFLPFCYALGHDQMAPAVAREMAIMRYQVEPEFRRMHRTEWTLFNKRHDHRVEEANRAQKAVIPEGIITQRKITNSALTVNLIKSQERVTKKILDMTIERKKGRRRRVDVGLEIAMTLDAMKKSGTWLVEGRTSISLPATTLHAIACR